MAPTSRVRSKSTRPRTRPADKALSLSRRPLRQPLRQPKPSSFCHLNRSAISQKRRGPPALAAFSLPHLFAIFIILTIKYLVVLLPPSAPKRPGGLRCHNL